MTDEIRGFSIPFRIDRETGGVAQQSGDDTLLRRMGRGYTVAQYRALVDHIRAAMPGVGLATDVIVGFPGETEEHFEQTLDLLREVCFGQVFAFAFSPRPRTPAARLCRRLRGSSRPPPACPGNPRPRARWSGRTTGSRCAHCRSAWHAPVRWKDG